ncbi:MAG: GNAT family N-acetyltransferase [Bryobacterales bacterium]|nr:GNAT family N-acetyltransferase [Bryobacterales bacterium]
MTIRPLCPSDLPAVEEIQNASAEAAAWPVQDYLATICLVALEQSDTGEESLLGFAAGRQSVPQEAEVLNIAVHPSARRRGVARILLSALLGQLQGEVFLELRASNLPALRLYESLGFHRAGTRPSYYSHPGEDAIVLRFQPC